HANLKSKAPRRIGEDGKPEKRKPIEQSYKRKIDRTLRSIVLRAAEDGFFGEGNRQGFRCPWKAPKKPRPKKRDSVRGEGIGTLLAAAFHEGGPKLAATVVLQLLTGERRGELNRLRWDDDLRRVGDGAWELVVPPEITKTGEPGLDRIEGAGARVL